MLTLLLTEISEESAQYRYFPEGKGQSGELLLNRTNGNIEILQRADNDEFDIYLHHAVASLGKYHKNGIFPKEDVVAWY